MSCEDFCGFCLQSSATWAGGDKAGQGIARNVAARRPATSGALCFNGRCGIYFCFVPHGDEGGLPIVLGRP